MKNLLLLSAIALFLVSCSEDEPCCGTVREKKITYDSKDMPTGYSVKTECGTFQVSKEEYFTISMSSTYCK